MGSKVPPEPDDGGVAVVYLLIPIYLDRIQEGVHPARNVQIVEARLRYSLREASRRLHCHRDTARDLTSFIADSLRREATRRLGLLGVDYPELPADPGFDGPDYQG